MARISKPNPFEQMTPTAGELFLRAAHRDSCIVGIDEAGRGPLAGPVVAAAVVLANLEDISGLNDSKKLSEEKREALFPLIQERALAWAIAEASPGEIDRINILQADFLAMRRCLLALGLVGIDATSPTGERRTQVWSRGMFTQTNLVLAVDGNLKIFGVLADLQIPVVKGDAHVASIAAASILAKVHRDRQMQNMDSKYPQYGFAGHKGYPTAAHLDAIRLHGLCAEHRRSFKPKALDQLALF